MNEWVGGFVVGGIDCGGEIFFFGGCDVMGNTDGGSGGWKDICTYPMPEEGLQFIWFRMAGFLVWCFLLFFSSFFCVLAFEH